MTSDRDILKLFHVTVSSLRARPSHELRTTPTALCNKFWKVFSRSRIQFADITWSPPNIACKINDSTFFAIMRCSVKCCDCLLSTAIIDLFLLCFSANKKCFSSLILKRDVLEAGRRREENVATSSVKRAYSVNRCERHSKAFPNNN